MKQLQLIYLYLTVAYQVFWVNRRMMKKLVLELNQVGVLVAPLSPKKAKRMRHYILLMQLVAGWACALRGYGLSESERRNVAYLGSITPLLDDLTDTLKITSRELLRAIKEKKGTTNNIGVVAYLHEQLMRIRQNDFQQLFHVTLTAQDASLAQVGSQLLTEAEIRKITADKGGGATLLYRAVLVNPLKDGEAQAFTTLGHALQQINDMFDLHKDFVQRQQTLFTRSTDLMMNKKEFNETLDLMKRQFLKLDYEPAHIRKCLLLISIVTSRGMVCLDQLLGLQAGKGSFDLAGFTREQLVCDMEKPLNMAASFRYSTKFIPGP